MFGYLFRVEARPVERLSGFSRGLDSCCSSRRVVANLGVLKRVEACCGVLRRVEANSGLFAIRGKPRPFKVCLNVLSINLDISRGCDACRGFSRRFGVFRRIETF